MFWKIVAVGGVVVALGLLGSCLFTCNQSDMNRNFRMIVSAVCVLICVGAVGTCFAGKTNESNPLTSMQGLLIVFCVSAVVGLVAFGLGRRR